MTDTINNVPRELLERVKSLCEYWFVRGQQQHMSESEHKTWHALGFGSGAFTELRTLLSAPSPAGVDGLEVVRKACEAANCKYPEMDAMADFKRDVTPSVVIGLLDGIRHAKGIAAINDARANGCAETVQFLRLELSDATSIIDGLRGEVERLTGLWELELARAQKAENELAHAVLAIDQQAQRIGELEGLLRDANWSMYASPPCQSGLVERCCCRKCVHGRIDAALSAGKEVE